MPLLMSSRITSAGFTPSRSARSLTVIVDGSSIAPRSRGSATWTLACGNAPSRRCGFLGPRRPRVPLLLLATGSSLVFSVMSGRPRLESLPNVVRERHAEGARDDVLVQCRLPARAVGAQVGAAAGHATRRVQDDRAIRHADDPHQVPLVARRSAGDAGPTGRATQSRPGCARGAAPGRSP